MSLTFNQPQGDGVTLSYPIVAESGYFTDEDIIVELIDVDTGDITTQTIDTDYTIEDDSVIFVTAPTNDYYVRVRREVTLDSPYSTFTRGNAFGRDNINNSFLQALYQIQQIADGFLPDDFYLKADMNAGSKQINQLAEGEADNDAATIGQLNDRVAINETYLIAAQAAQAASELAQSLAEAAQAAAELAENNAEITSESLIVLLDQIATNTTDIATLTAAIALLELSPEEIAALQASVDGFSADLETTNSNVTTNTSLITTLQSYVDATFANVSHVTENLHAPYRTELTTTDDLDNLSDGWYCWTNLPINGPDTYMCMLQVEDPNQKIQIAFGTDSNQVYVRRANNGVFNSWTNMKQDADEILSLLKTVDTNSSGLNANYLQGYSASAFQLASTAFTGVMSLKSSRTSTGLWTISGLTVRRPLVLAVASSTASEDSPSIQYRVTNGSSEGTTGAASTMWTLGHDNVRYNANAHSCIIIPTSSTVYVTLYRVDSGMTIRAYQ